MNMLKRNGPNMDPWGTPWVMGSHSLFILSIRARWLRFFFRYDMIRLQLSIDNPYACNLARSRWCGKQSKALLRSTSIAPTILLLSRASFQSSTILRTVVSQLWPFLKAARNLDITLQKYSTIWSLYTLSNILDTQGRILIGLKLFQVVISFKDPG